MNKKESIYKAKLGEEVHVSFFMLDPSVPKIKCIFVDGDISTITWEWWIKKTSKKDDFCLFTKRSDKEGMDIIILNSFDRTNAIQEMVNDIVEEFRPKSEYHPLVDCEELKKSLLGNIER